MYLVSPANFHETRTNILYHVTLPATHNPQPTTHYPQPNNHNPITTTQ